MACEMSCSLSESDELLEDESSAESSESVSAGAVGMVSCEFPNNDAAAAMLLDVLKNAGTATVSVGSCTASSSVGAVAPRN